MLDQTLESQIFQFLVIVYVFEFQISLEFECKTL